ncbi:MULTISPECIES: transposase [unclassified Mesorhizobium]|uniref:IS66-like element accessory protein TnpA n=1 Tax=unclassified Mesorhizobium TaxID=325217 RepID=UPI000FDBCDDE|nr:MULTISPECIES: transposase [unclassified Mesorhizobium]TGQ46951.1 IS66 family insertion sequence element accessory protein TnpB [Mesorhizobium sp. M00.F.Ca.ET.216.01.1.1]TIU42744.1 MAG: IS66 family insertion sequence element accessory protein TnpB [Mesorhizobium sp.]TIV62370.1 MAG: IS66 family insertion sequence element accessory protein TnpB [Mesorhizobium sp.]
MEEDDQKLRVRLVGRNGRRRYDPVSKDRLVAACLEPGASVSGLALEHGVNANLLWKWIRKQRLAKKETLPSPPLPTPAFIPVQIESAADRAMSRQSSAAALDLPATRGEVRRSEPERIAPFSSPAKVNASLPNGVKLALECGDVDALAAVIGALGHVQTQR